MFLLSLIAIASAAAPLEPQRLHDDLLVRFESRDLDTGCLTGLVKDLSANWELFSSAERKTITSALAPFKADLLDPLASAPPAPPAAGFATDTCFGQQGDNRLTGAHFAVEWDEGSVTENVAQSFLDDLEYSYEIEVDQYGWKAPELDGQYLMLALIADQNMQGAYTTVEYCGGGYAPYIVTGKDAANWGDWTSEMASHEFNHALQFGYGFAAEFWWWEATATFIEDIVFPDTNGWAQYITGYSQSPEIAMGASDQNDQDIFWHMYGMAIWAFYLNDYQGGPDTVRATWELAAEERGTYAYGGQDMVEALGLDWHTTYIDFITRNASMDYEQHRYFPNISKEATVDELPASGEGDGNARPQGYGQNYIRIDGGLGEGDLQVIFAGESEVDWAVVLAETDGEDIVQSVNAVATSGEDTVLTLTGYGYDDVYLIVSPLDESDDKRNYTWSAELVEASPVDSGGDWDGLVDGPGGGEKVGGCGCATTPGPSAPGLAFFGLGLWLRRRLTVR